MAAVYPSRQFLMNAGSSNMAVNGSVTPVAFTVAPAAGQILSANELILNATGQGNITQPLTGFWSFASLAVGISSEIRLNGVSVIQAGLIKTNFDLIQFIGADFLGKILGTRNIVRGGFMLNPPLNLNGSRGDYFRMTINDNMISGGDIEQFTVALRGSIFIS